MAKEIIRSCIGCGRKRPKTELIRVALFKDGGALPDLKRKLGGRGVYLCPRIECIDAAAKKKPPKAALIRSAGPALTEALKRVAKEVDQIPKGVS